MYFNSTGLKKFKSVKKCVLAIVKNYYNTNEQRNRMTFNGPYLH